MCPAEPERRIELLASEPVESFDQTCYFLAGVVERSNIGLH